MSSELTRARIALFMVTAIACCGLLMLPWTKITLDRQSFYGALPSVALLFALALYLHWRGMIMLRGLMDVLGCAVLISYAGLVWSYTAISFALPLADERLLALDRSLGFDWLAFARMIDGMPWLAAALFAAYQSFMFQLLLLPLLLVALGHAPRGYMLVAGFGLLCMSASVISIWFPALGAHVALDVDPLSLKNLNPHFGYAFLEQFHAARDSAEFRLSADRAAGILTFPSVHAGAAFLCAWAASAIRRLKWPMVMLNIAMAVSAISHGSHYLVDIVAGIGLAAAVAFALRLFVVGRSSRPDGYPAPHPVH